MADSTAPVRRSRWWQLLLLGLAFWLLWVLAKAPATLLANLVQSNLPGSAISAVTGSFWRGQAGEVVLPLYGVNYSLGATRWRVRPLRLLSLELCLELEAELNRQQVQGLLCVNPAGTVRIADTDITVPAAVATLWQAPPADGLLSLHIAAAELHNGALERASGSASWQQGRVLLFERWLELGTYGTRFQTNGRGVLEAEVMDVTAPLELQLSASSELGKSLVLKGKLRARQNLDPQLAQGLQFLGTPDSEGFYLINQSLGLGL